MRILITRPEPDASDLADVLKARGHSVLLAPMLDILALPEPDLDLTDVGVVVFTSRNALRAVRDWRQYDALKSRIAFCVGARTYADLEAAGFSSVSPHSATASDLVEDMENSLGAGREAGDVNRILHLSGDEVSGDLVGALRSSGYDAERVVVYQAREAGRLTGEAATALAAGDVDCATFYSPRTARTFARLAAVEDLAPCLSETTALCLSDKVADGLGALRGSFRDVSVTRNPKGQEMLALIDLVAAQLHH